MPRNGPEVGVEVFEVAGVRFGVLNVLRATLLHLGGYRCFVTFESEVNCTIGNDTHGLMIKNVYIKFHHD